MKSLFTLEASKGGLSRPQQDHQPHTEAIDLQQVPDQNLRELHLSIGVDFEVDRKSVTKEDEIVLLLADEFGNEKVSDKTDYIFSTSYKHKHFNVINCEHELSCLQSRSGLGD